MVLFCIPCLLFGRGTTWTTTGFKDMKHLSENKQNTAAVECMLIMPLNPGLFGRMNVAADIGTVFNRATEVYKLVYH